MFKYHTFVTEFFRFLNKRFSEWTIFTMFHNFQLEIKIGQFAEGPKPYKQKSFLLLLLRTNI